MWSSASLRLAAIFSLLFGIGGLVLIAALDFGLTRFAENEVRGALAHQMEIMRADAAENGSAALIEQLASQSRNREARRYLFLVVAPDGKTFSNGLTTEALGDLGFHRSLATKGRPTRWPDQSPNMLTLSQTADDGGLLAVGRDTQYLDELRSGFRALAIWGGLALIALAILAGLTIGHLFLGRLDAVNRAAARVIAGRESERLPPIGFGREFDDLASNLNRMLDRQETTLTALKTVSEGMAHDLRTPLARLRNRLEEAEAAADDVVARRTALNQAAEEADQLNGLLESLLALSRLEGGAARLDLKPMDAGELARSVGEIYRPVIEEAGGALTLDAPGAGLILRGEASLLAQTLSNLIDNALVHGGGAAIAVTARRDGDQIVLAVSDHGPGVPPQERENVLRRFYRLDQSRALPGSGLGLAMAAAVVRAHGGELALLDNAPGLRIEMRLPTAAAGDRP